MSARTRKSSSHQPSGPSQENPRDPEVEETLPENGTSETATETLPEETGQEEPAQVQLTIKGSDKSARAAAKRFGGEPTKPAAPIVATPSNDAEPPDEDPIAMLLADGKNMVIVTRQTPRNIRDQRGQKIVTNVRLPGKYTCPTSIAAIEDQVFNEHWGATYKCTIHPDTSNGENQILGHFKIEHPDPKAPPYIEGVTDVDETTEETTEIPTRGDPTLRETDTLVEVREQLKRQLDRANTMKEIQETKKLIKQINDELDGRPDNKPAAPSVESEEIRKLREDNAKLTAALAEKKVSDRFDRLEDSIGKLAAAVATNATVKPAGGEDSIVLKMLNQSQQHAKDMVELMKDKAKPAAPSTEGDLDKFLDRVTKLNTITGAGPTKGGGGRLSELENKLIDMSFDRLTGGNGGGDGDDNDGDPFESAVKLAIKEFAPIAKTYVDKKMDQESAASGGQQVPKEVIQKIQVEAAQAAARKVQEDLAAQGLVLQQTSDGRLVALPAAKGGTKVVTPRGAGTRVVSETRTAGGVVKKVSIKPDDLSAKPKPSAEESSASATESTKGGEVAKSGVFPMLGPNGAELKIEFPIRPGDIKYDRKYSVDFILDGIRSEIRQGLPQKAQTDQKIESYVIGDAMEFLDDEVLNQLDGVDSGPALESLLGPWGSQEKIAEIKKAGEDDVVGSYLRKLVLSIQREWQREKSSS